MSRAAGSEVVQMSPDRMRFDVASGGGLLVIQRSYQALFRARSGDAELPVLPVNLSLLGVVVPAGEHEVVVDVDSPPRDRFGCRGRSVSAVPARCSGARGARSTAEDRVGPGGSGLRQRQQEGEDQSGFLAGAEPT